MNPVAFTLFGHDVRWYGILIGTGMRALRRASCMCFWPKARTSSEITVPATSPGSPLAIIATPLSIGVRLLHCVPLLLGFALCYFWNPIYGAMIVFAYYMLIGFTLSRFVTASYTNAVFDKYLNSHIEGAKVNQGLRQADEDEEDEEENPGEEKEGKENEGTGNA